MTQFELSDEICSLRELQRLEKGEHSPSFYTIEKLLKKLGVDTSKQLYPLLKEDSHSVHAKISEINTCIFEHDYKLAENKFLSFKDQTYFDTDDPFIKQFSLLSESTFLLELYHNPKEALKSAVEAIKVTLPKFDLSHIDYIDTRPLVHEEYVIIINIALCYIDLDNIDVGIDIFHHLKKSITQNKVPAELKLLLLPTIYYNHSKFLGLEKRYKEALAVCDERIEACRNAKTLKSLGELYYNKACDLYFLDDKVGAQKNFQRSYNIFSDYGNSKMMAIVKKNAIEKYGISIIID